MKRSFLFGILLLGVMMPCYAQTESLASSEVLTWEEGTPPPRATLDLVTWLEGSWEGALPEGMQQHIVLAPAADQMPGFARGWTSEGDILFYEINVFTEVGESIEYHVKHVSSELFAWEGQDGFVRHRLVRFSDEALFFDGITFVKNGPDSHIVYFRIPEGEREGEVIVVHQRRLD